LEVNENNQLMGIDIYCNSFFPFNSTLVRNCYSDSNSPQAFVVVDTSFSLLSYSSFIFPPVNPRNGACVSPYFLTEGVCEIACPDNSIGIFRKCYEGCEFDSLTVDSVAGSYSTIDLVYYKCSGTCSVVSVYECKKSCKVDEYGNPTSDMKTCLELNDPETSMIENACVWLKGKLSVQDSCVDVVNLKCSQINLKMSNQNLSNNLFDLFLSKMICYYFN
jgi:hypothetical protein